MDTIETRTVRTRKAHRCWGCAIKFEPKTVMEVITASDEGRIIHTYWCNICSAYWSQHMHWTDEIMQGDLTCEEHYKEFKEKYLTTI